MHAVAAAICVLMINAAVLFAQDTAQTPAGSNSAQRESAQKPDQEQRGLPVSLDRIRMELAIKPPTTSIGGIRLNATVEVVGKAPPIVLWDPDQVKEALRGPAPFGPPTQKEVLELTAPYKRYPFDMNALMRWLTEKLETEKKSE